MACRRRATAEGAAGGGKREGSTKSLLVSPPMRARDVLLKGCGLVGEEKKNRYVVAVCLYYVVW